MELEKKLILDEAPSVNEISRRLKSAQRAPNKQKHAAADSSIYHDRSYRTTKKGFQNSDSDTTIDSENTWFSRNNRPWGLENDKDIEQQFELENQEGKLEIIKRLFEEKKVHINPNDYLVPMNWIAWFRAMKAKEILKGPKDNVFMHILADPRAKMVVLQDDKIFNIVYNAYAKNYLDETLESNACGKNFLAIVLNASTYKYGQPAEYITETFKIINNLIQSGKSWDEIFRIVCYPKSKKLKNYTEIIKDPLLKDANTMNSDKMTNKERANAFNKESEKGKQDYLNKYVGPILQDEYTKEYIKKKYNGTQNK